MLASQALRASRAIKPCSDGLIAFRSSGSFANRGVLASSAILSNVLSPAERAVQVRHASNKESNAPHVKNLFKQNDLEALKEKHKPRPVFKYTDGDVPASWIIIGFIIILAIGTRVVSILTGGDKPEEHLWGPRPKPNDKD